MKLPLFIYAIFITVSFYAQNAVFPENGTIYDGNLHKVELEMTPTDVSSLFSFSNRWTDTKYPTNLKYDNVLVLSNCGVRIKGNTSRNSYKQSIKIDTDQFINQDFQGLKTFNLNGNHNDPSMTREVLSSYIMNKIGIISARANFVNYYINGTFNGVYSNNEQINKKFLTSRFGNNNGNLYKISFPGDLKFIDLNQSSYKNLIQNNPLMERVYELKTNEKIDDYSDLVNLIQVINNSTSSEFQSKIESIFDVDAYLKVLAAEVLIGHWDNYSYNKNNYYLYNNPTTKKFVYIPYDMDNTFGVNWGFPDVATKDINKWHNPLNAPLTEKLLSYENYRVIYQAHIKQIIETVFNEQHLFPIIDNLKNTINSSIAIDPNFQGISGYGFNYTSWNNSYTLPTFSHSPIGIKPYISQRVASALNQLNLLNTDNNTFKIKQNIVFPNPSNQEFIIKINQSTKADLYDETGKKIKELSLTNGENKINASSFNKGIYYIKFKNSQIGTQKIIIK